MYLINGNFCYNIQYILLYIISCSCTTSCIDNLSKTNCFVFSESGCKITAFSRHDQISWKIFWIIFVTHWFSVPIFLSSHPHFFQHFIERTLVISESGCKGTAFLWHEQIFMQNFYIFFVTHWFSKNMLYNINFGNDIHVEPAIQNYPISQLRDFLKLQRLSEGRAKDERRTSEGRAVVNTTKMCIRNNCIAKN